MLKRLCCAVLCIALLAGLPVTSLAAEQSVVIAVGDPGEGQRDWSQNAVFAAMQPVASSTLRFTQLQRNLAYAVASESIRLLDSFLVGVETHGHLTLHHLGISEEVDGFHQVMLIFSVVRVLLTK